MKVKKNRGCGMGLGCFNILGAGKGNWDAQKLGEKLSDCIEAQSD